MLCYTGTEENIIQAIAQINFNCGFPSGGTTTWAIAQQEYDQDFWYIPMPPPGGYKNGEINLTQAQMIENVINVEIQEFNNSWAPPIQP